MRRDARIAGILYVLLGVIAPVRLIYIPNTVLVSGNAQATAANIASHEATFRMAILTDVAAGVLFLNGGAYVLLSVLGILSPSLEAKASGLVFPALLAEVVVMFWLAFGRLRPDSLLAADL